MKHLKSIIASTLLAGTLITACTKPDRSDDFPAGDPPPVSGGFTNSNQIAASNLVAYWGFDGTLLDSVSGTTGTNAGMTFVEGLKGQAIKGAPAASKAYATAPASDAVKALTKYTISCWINSTMNDGATGLVSIGNTVDFWGNINMFLEGGATATMGRFKTVFADNGVTQDNGIQELDPAFNTWVQYLITYDGAGTFKSYLNGSEVGTKATGWTATHFVNVGPIVFGALHFMTVPSSTAGSAGEGWAGYLPGKIDEVRIYDRALTANEISALSILERQGR